MTMMVKLEVTWNRMSSQLVSNNYSPEYGHPKTSVFGHSLDGKLVSILPGEISSIQYIAQFCPKLWTQSSFSQS